MLVQQKLLFRKRRETDKKWNFGIRCKIVLLHDQFLDQERLRLQPQSSAKKLERPWRMQFCKFFQNLLLPFFPERKIIVIIETEFFWTPLVKSSQDIHPNTKLSRINSRSIYENKIEHKLNHYKRVFLRTSFFKTKPYWWTLWIYVSTFLS